MIIEANSLSLVQAGTSWAGSLFSSFGFAATADSASNSSGNNRSDAASASASESRSAPPGLDSIFSKEEILTMEKQRQMQAEQYRLEAERKKRERASENPSTVCKGIEPHPEGG